MSTDGLPSIHETAAELVTGGSCSANTYRDLNADAVLSLQDAKLRIQGVQRKGLELIVAIGHELVRVQGIIGERVYEWASAEVGIGKSSVHNYMAVAQRFGDPALIPTVGILPMRTVYALATHLVPDTAVEEVLSRVKAGEKPRLSEIKKVISRHRQSGQAEVSLAEDSHDELARSAQRVDLSSASEVRSFALALNDVISTQPLLLILTSLLKYRSHDFDRIDSEELSMVTKSLEQLLTAATNAQELRSQGRQD